MINNFDILKNQLDDLSQKVEFAILCNAKHIIQKRFYETLDNWFKIYKIPNLCAGSLRSLKNVIRILKLHIQDKFIHELRPIDFEKCLNSLPMSKTRKDVYSYSKQFMRFAYYNKYIAEDISVYIGKVRYKAREGTAYTREQIQTMFSLVKNKKVLYLFKFYYLTGCRRGEAFSLTWQDIDKITNTIHIHGTKTISSNRFIPISKQLRELFNLLPRGKPNQNIFNITAGAIRWEIEHLKEKVNFNVNIKNFRTTFATRCADIGISPKVVQSWLGHTDIRTTNKYYIKSTPNLHREELALFNLKY